MHSHTHISCTVFPKDAFCFKKKRNIFAFTLTLKEYNMLLLVWLSSDLDPLHAPHWSVRVRTAENPQCLLGKKAAWLSHCNTGLSHCSRTTVIIVIIVFMQPLSLPLELRSSVHLVFVTEMDADWANGLFCCSCLKQPLELVRVLKVLTYQGCGTTAHRSA